MSGYRIVTILGAALWLIGCATTGGVPRPFPDPGGGSPDPSSQSDRFGAPTEHAVVITALALRGTPYRSGGSEPSGFDCSGLVSYVFSQNGISLPRTVAEQFRSGAKVKTSALRAGDLVFFTTTAAGASHVGIMVGTGEFVHAPAERGEVRVERLEDDYWASRFIGARRVR